MYEIHLLFFEKKVYIIWMSGRKEGGRERGKKGLGRKSVLYHRQQHRLNRNRGKQGDEGKVLIPLSDTYIHSNSSWVMHNSQEIQVDFSPIRKINYNHNNASLSFSMRNILVRRVEAVKHQSTQ